jgi:hypothetical protein
MKLRVPNPAIAIVAFQWDFPVEGGVVDIPERLAPYALARGYTSLDGTAGNPAPRAPRRGIREIFRIKTTRSTK